MFEKQSQHKINASSTLVRNSFAYLHLLFFPCILLTKYLIQYYTDQYMLPVNIVLLPSMANTAGAKSVFVKDR